MLAIWSGWSVVAAAGGTLAAIATIALVIVTWMLVDRTQAMARTAQRQLAASSEPLLVDVEHNSGRTGEHDYEIEYDDGGTSTVDQSWVAVYAAPSEGVLVSFPLRNVGSGVAVVSGAALKVGDETFAGRVVRRFIAPGELGRFEWQWATAGPNAAAIRAAISAGVLSVAVEYADFGGRRSTVSRPVES
jgi:hypothetical protein